MLCIACVFIYLIHSYNNTNNLEQENFFADGEQTVDSPNVVNTPEEEPHVLVGNDQEEGEVLPSEQEGENETFRTVPRTCPRKPVNQTMLETHFPTNVILRIH